MDPAYVHLSTATNNDKKLKLKQLADLDIYSIGRYGGWKYCSIEDNIQEAKLLAECLV